MDTVYKIWAFLGFIAFMTVGGLRQKVNRMERSLNADTPDTKRSVRPDIGKILEAYIGKEVAFDFNEDEEDEDMLVSGNDAKYTLLDMDEKWALIRIEKPKQTMHKMIRLSSIKGITVPGDSDH